MTATVTLLDGTSQTFNVTTDEVAKWVNRALIYHRCEDEAVYIIPFASILGIVVEGA